MLPRDLRLHFQHVNRFDGFQDAFAGEFDARLAQLPAAELVLGSSFADATTTLDALLDDGGQVSPRSESAWRVPPVSA